MLKLIYLYNNFHINKISITFMFVSSLLIFFAINTSIELDLNSLSDLRNFNSIKAIFLNDSYNVLEIIISMFVVILSFMELFSNSHLFDVVLIARNNKIKVLTAKVISYISIIIVYNIVIFSISALIAVRSFNDVSLFYNFFNLFKYCLLISVFTIIISLILLTLFKNYFASFIILLVVIIKRIVIETEQPLLTKFIPYFNIESSNITITTPQIFCYLLILLFTLFIIFKKKDIKT